MKDRVISSVVIMLLLIAIVVFNSSVPILLNIAIAIISSLCVFELIKASGLQRHWALTIPSLAIAFVLPFSSLIVLEIRFALYCIYSFIMFFMLIVYHKTISFKDLAIIYSMSIMIPSALETIVLARSIDGNHGIFYAIIAVMAAWIPDVGAFFTGTFLGKHKLCPEISPKKTIEGFFGGVIVNVIAMVLCGLFFSHVYYGGEPIAANLWIMALIGAGGAAVGTVGDLSFSIIKRSCGIKDFGHIIPGHGGLLDRFDSVMFTAPFVFLVSTFLPAIIK